MYDFQGRGSVRPSVLEAVISWERLRKGKTVTVPEALRVYDQMSSGKGVARGYKKLPGVNPDTEVSMGDLMTFGGLVTDKIWHEALDRLDPREVSYMLKALRKGEKLTKEPRVRLSTIHGSKGGEATHVVLLTDMARRTHQEAEREPEDEARVWYVAATRAKEHLSILAPQTRLSYLI